MSGRRPLKLQGPAGIFPFVPSADAVAHAHRPMRPEQSSNHPVVGEPDLDEVGAIGDVRPDDVSNVPAIRIADRESHGDHAANEDVATDGESD